MAKTLFDFCHARDCMELLTQWDCRANLPLTPQTIFHGSRKSVWWKCEKDHHWRASVNSRTSGKTNCPYCSGRIAWPGETDLASRFPALAKEWHPTKNGNLQPTQISPVSKRRVWWICPRGHEYLSAVGRRTMRKSGCPYCDGKKVLAGFNDLATTYPQIAAQWHPNLNGALTPQMVTAGSHKKAWWICTEGHVWKAFIYSRTGKHQRGCPVCAGVVNEKRKARYESMAPETDRSGSGENRVNLTKEDTR